MKDNEDKYIRGFYWLNKAWYAKANKLKNGRIAFGIYNITGGGTTGEMIMKWHDLGDCFAPRLEAFEDSWKSLASFKDVIDVLALVDGKRISEEEFVKILLDCGFTDLTKKNC